MSLPKQLVLIRHGESEANVIQASKKSDPEFQSFIKAYDAEWNSEETRELAERLRNRFAYPRGDRFLRITQEGERQARETARCLHEEEGLEPPDMVFLSPYVRTLQTYEAMHEAWPALPDPHDQSRVYHDSRLRERGFGQTTLVGDLKIFFTLHPNEKLLYDLDPHAYQFPNGEDTPSVLDRTRAWIDVTLRKCAEQNVWVISHFFTTLALRSNLERWGLDQFMKEEGAELINCAVTMYHGSTEQIQNSQLILQYYNRKFFE